jgi:hypothetical protein
MRARLFRWIPLLLVATVGASTLSSLTAHSRCITAHHACDSTPSILDCCCTHVGAGDTQSAAAASETNPLVILSPAAAPPHADHARDPLAVGGAARCSRLALFFDRVTLFAALLI